MSDSRFLRVFTTLERHRGLVVGGLCVLLAAAGISLVRIRFDNTLDLMLPSNSPAQRMMSFLREANFSNKIVISLEAAGPAMPREELLAASDTLAASLQSPLISKVVTGYSVPDLMGDAGFFIRYAPQILTSNDLAALERQMTTGGISGVVSRLYLQLLKPEGMFMARAMQSDPLGINQVILGRMQKLSTSMGYDVALENGHFISRDGRHTMLLAETTVPLTDAEGAREVLDFLNGKLAGLPAGIRASLVCGHTHVVSNEDTIKRDLGVVLSLASLAFIILYVAFFRDARALMIFLLPVLAGIIALAVTALIFPRLSYFVIAFGPVIAGIADDYGIAAYVAIRYGSNRAESVRHILRPVTAGALTTAGIFLAFFFSSIPGYYQLAWFCVLSISLTVVLALFFMPLFLRPEREPESDDSSPSFIPPKHARLRVWMFLALFVTGGVLAGRVTFDSDVTRLDGTAPAIVAAEEEFRTVWGTGERKEAILAVMGGDEAEVREKTDALYQDALAALGTNELVSLSSVWPSEKTRAIRARAWTDFWQDGRAATLNRLLVEQGAARGFATNAFAPFFARLYEGAVPVDEPASNQVLANLKERFIQTPRGHCQTLSFFPDTPATVAALEGVVTNQPSAIIVSRTALGAILSRSFTGEVVRTSLLGGVLIILLALLFVRRVSLTLIALSPAFAAVVGLLATMAVLGRPMNVANLISGIVVFGLSIDFGMHILHACRHPQGAHARTAVTFAAITTVMGAGALVFAHHPALYSIGVTLVVGVGLGYGAAMWMVPALYGVFAKEEP